MKLFFDTSAIQRTYGGISIYSASLLRSMMTLFPENEYHTGCKTLRRAFLRRCIC